MLYYTILYYTILYYTILYYTILYYTTLLRPRSLGRLPRGAARARPATKCCYIIMLYDNGYMIMLHMIMLYNHAIHIYIYIYTQIWFIKCVTVCE